VEATFDPAPGAADGPVATRQCYFPHVGGSIDTAVFNRSALRRGRTLAGPAVVHQPDSTTVIPPGYACRVDAQGNLVLDRSGS
jgi:N-methylhydantoinase A